MTVSPLAGARKTDAVLPGHLLAAAWPKGPEGRRCLIALVTPDDPKAEGTPKGLRSLYRIDPDRAGAPRKLLDGLPEEIDALAAVDLDGGGEEILLGRPGKIFSVGSPEAPTPPQLLLEAAGLDLRHWSAGSPRSFQAATVGRLRTWTLDDGRMVPGPTLDLPVRAAREAQALRLSSLPATPIPLPGGGPPLQAVGPEGTGKLRLRTVLFDAAGTKSEAWAQLPGKETVDSFRYQALDGKPALLVTTSDAETLGVFAKQRFRLFPLAADRSRSGQPPAVAFETESQRWFPVESVLLDLDRDGRDDLVVLQPEGLGGGDLVVDAFFGQGEGRFERPRRVKLGNLEARAWIYGKDLTGDGVPDLVTFGKAGLSLFAGTTEPRMNLLDRRPRRTLDLKGAQGTITMTVNVGSEGLDATTRPAALGGPTAEDLDADGRPEILLLSASDRGRGRILALKL